MNTAQAVKYLKSRGIALTERGLRRKAAPTEAWPCNADIVEFGYVPATKVSGKWQFTEEALDAYIVAQPSRPYQVVVHSMASATITEARIVIASVIVIALMVVIYA